MKKDKKKRRGRCERREREAKAGERKGEEIV